MNTKKILMVVVVVLVAVGVWALFTYTSPSNKLNTADQPTDQIPSDRLRSVSGEVVEIKPNEIIFNAGPDQFTAQISAETKYLSLKSNGTEQAIKLEELKAGSMISVYFYEEAAPKTYKAEKIYKRN